MPVSEPTISGWIYDAHNHWWSRDFQGLHGNVAWMPPYLMQPERWFAGLNGKPLTSVCGGDLRPVYTGPTEFADPEDGKRAVEAVARAVGCEVPERPQ